jgi:hypothetical protein
MLQVFCKRKSFSTFMGLKNQRPLVWLARSQQPGKRKEFGGRPSGSSQDGKIYCVAQATMMLLYKNETKPHEANYDNGKPPLW